VAERGGDTAFDFTQALGNPDAAEFTLHPSGVAPSFPSPPYGSKSKNEIDPRPSIRRDFAFHRGDETVACEALTQ
jgi:hypothetical protein